MSQKRMVYGGAKCLRADGLRGSGSVSADGLQGLKILKRSGLHILKSGLQILKRSGYESADGLRGSSHTGLPFSGSV